jgi:uncharacterized membrane protein YfcA
MLAALGFVVTAVFLSVLIAIVVAPAKHKVVGAVAVATALGYNCLGLLYFRNPDWPWSAWYCTLYVTSILAGAAIAYFLAVALMEQLEELGRDP